MRRQVVFAATPLVVSGALLFGLLITLADAKPARCYTTDEGEYDCEFVITDRDGSFRISAPGKPTFSLVMDGPGRGYGIDDFGNGGVNLPGVFIRNKRDPACWVNDATSARVCAW